MTPHQSFTELCAIAIAITGGKLFGVVAQTIPTSDWFERLTGPLGALFAMGIMIWWLSNRNAKQDAKLEEKQKMQDIKDDQHLQSRVEAMRVMTEALESTKRVVAQNNKILERNSKALERHKCVQND
jgi:hypothetical protein